MGSEIQLRPFSAKTKLQCENSAYIGWSPVRLTVIGRKEPGETNRIRLKCRSLTSDNTKIEFKADSSTAPVDELEINLNDDGEAGCFVSGKFQNGNRHNGASPEGKDVRIEAAWVDSLGEVKGSLDFMIRVRRDAQEMTDQARDDFIWALAELNGCGKGVYVTDFVAMHVLGASDSQHGDSHFLPWHRLYLLDLERLLQKVKPSVTLPYWRFDKPAPRVFSEEFMGATSNIPFDGLTPGTSNGECARFSSTNRLSDWKIGSTNGIERVAFFDTKSQSAGRPPAWHVQGEDDTLGLGGDEGGFEFGFPIFSLDNSTEAYARLPSGFARMEGMPHGAAHVSFNGPINNVPSAPQDPLFFLLHCNVDRLWAKWQFVSRKDTPTEYGTYPYQNKREAAFVTPSHFLGLFPEDNTIADSLQWPWDDTWSKPHNLRPPGTRSRNFTKSATGKDISESMPTLRDAFDAFGYHPPEPNMTNFFSNYLGYSYDDVPFEHARAVS